MARFPKSEAEVAALTQQMIHGLTANPEDFSSPPVAPEDLQTALATYIAARHAAVTSAAAAAQGTAAKDDALQTLGLDHTALRFRRHAGPGVLPRARLVH